MKNLILILCLFSFAYASCNKTKSNNEISPNRYHNLTASYSSIETDESINSTSYEDAEFMHTLTSLNLGENEMAANYIINSIEYLKQESIELTSNKKANINEIIGHFNNVFELFKNGNIEDSTEAKEAVAVAELLAAKAYLILCKHYAIEVPERGYGNLEYAINKLRNVLYVLENNAVDEVSYLYKNCEYIIANLDIQSDRFAKEIQENIEHLSVLLNNYLPI